MLFYSAVSVQLALHHCRVAKGILRRYRYGRYRSGSGRCEWKALLREAEPGHSMSPRRRAFRCVPTHLPTCGEECGNTRMEPRRGVTTASSSPSRNCPARRSSPTVRLKEESESGRASGRAGMDLVDLRKEDCLAAVEGILEIEEECRCRWFAGDDVELDSVAVRTDVASYAVSATTGCQQPSGQAKVSTFHCCGPNVLFLI